MLRAGAFPLPPPLAIATLLTLVPPGAKQRLCELPGVGPKNAKLLKDKGYNSVDRLQEVRPASAARLRAYGQRAQLCKP